MTRKRFAEESVIGVLKAHEATLPSSSLKLVSQ